MLATHFRGGDRYVPSKFTKAVVVVICIQEVLSSNLAQVINYYPEIDFLWIASALQANTRIVHQIRPQLLPSTSFPSIYLSVILPFDTTVKPH
jgi:hypothetical protein